MAHQYVGIDPGKRTGLVILNDETGSLGVFARRTEAIFELGLQWVEGFYRQFQGQTVFILELPPRRKPGSEKTYPLFVRWNGALTVWTEANPMTQLITIGPGVWKPFVKANRKMFTKPKGWTQHEADALHMVQYWLLSSGVRAKQDDNFIRQIADRLTKEVRNAQDKKTKQS